jgi:hypothetical protein
MSKRGFAPLFYIFPSPLKERGTEVEGSSRGEVDNLSPVSVLFSG